LKIKIKNIEDIYQKKACVKNKKEKNTYYRLTVAYFEDIEYFSLLFLNIFFVDSS
jgi:hypothetical protein